MKRIFIAIFLLMLAYGCGGGAVEVSPQADSATVMDSERAYVTSGCLGPAHIGVTHTSLRYDEPRTTDKHHTSAPGMGRGYLYRMVALTPGTYTITSFAQDYSGGAYVMSNQARETNELAKIGGGLLGSFTVQKGKINYLGSISCDFQTESDKMKIDVQDRRAELMEYMSKKYPNIDAGRLVIYTPIKKGPYSE